jgi:outer membrane immunogenic protein
MTKIRLLALAAIVAGTANLPVFGYAEDISGRALASATPNWTGLYIGAAFGGRRTDSDISLIAIDEVSLGGVQHDLPICTTNIPPCGTQASFDKTAFRSAVYGGYNWQFAERWLGGIEGDWGWANNSSTEDGFKYFQANPGVLPDSSYTIRSNWDASARARIGFLATPSVLVFVTGGVSWLHTEITSDCGPISCFTDTYKPTELTRSTTWSGWTVGGGIEAMLTANWIVRAEYRYADYGSKSFLDSRACSPTPSPSCGNQTSLDIAYNLSMKTHTATIGLAYRFGPSR